VGAFVFGFAAALLISGAAVAQATAPGGKIDLTPIVVAIVGGFFSIATAVIGTWLTAVITKNVKDKAAATVLENAVQNSLGKLQQAGTQVATAAVEQYKPTLPVPQELQPAVQYVFDHAGDEAARFGLTQQKIADKIVSRLGLKNIETNLAVSQASAPVKVDGVEAPVVVPPMASVPSRVSAVTLGAG